MRKHIVALTGAGISAESGISTFRDANGLWEKHDIMDVASIEGWQRRPELVQQFYNLRRQQLHSVAPNAAHLALKQLEDLHEVSIVTQNVDDLHERAGSSRVLHLHGELRKARSTGAPHLVYDWHGDINMGDTCALGHQLRPHIVWFGEEVPLLPDAAALVGQADALLVIGSSMQVYPAAGLVGFARQGIPLFYIDPKPHINYELAQWPQLQVIESQASTGVPLAIERLLAMPAF